jgi:hypothetical protein
MTNKANRTLRSSGNCLGMAPRRAIVTLADLAPRQEVKGGAARVFGEASEPVLKDESRRTDPTRKPTKHR